MGEDIVSQNLSVNTIFDFHRVPCKERKIAAFSACFVGFTPSNHCGDMLNLNISYSHDRI